MPAMPAMPPILPLLKIIIELLIVAAMIWGYLYYKPRRS